MTKEEEIEKAIRKGLEMSGIPAEDIFIEDLSSRHGSCDCPKCQLIKLQNEIANLLVKLKTDGYSEAQLNMCLVRLLEQGVESQLVVALGE